MEDLAGVWLDLFRLGFGWDLFWSWRIWRDLNHLMGCLGWGYGCLLWNLVGFVWVFFELCFWLWRMWWLCGGGCWLLAAVWWLLIVFDEL